MGAYRFRQRLLRGAATAAACCALSWASESFAKQSTFEFNLPGQPLALTLRGFAELSGQQIIFTNEVVDNRQAPAVRGALTVDAALTKILQGSNLTAVRSPSGAVMIEPAPVPIRVAAATPARSSGAIETVTVTAERSREDIQTVPIAVTALTQKQLTERQIAGGPDLIKEVPNLTFSKTNFTGYNIEIRGIGTQAISVTTDPAVAVAFNGIPFIRNHFFEQEFFDVDNLEVLRGPQGTLWGRNATAGVVNISSAKPTDQYEVRASVDFGNYNNRRFEGMINIPLVDDHLDLRLAGEWTKRDGYSTNALTNNSSIDGRDLWSGRASLRWRPTTDLDINLVWEHFSEDDNRMRTAKQLCMTSQPPTSVNGVPVPPANTAAGTYGDAFSMSAADLSQGCQATSLYSPSAFQVPYGPSMPFVVALGVSGNLLINDPYASTTQSTNLRVIESAILPTYKAKNDTIELNTDYKLTPSLTFTSQTGYNQDYLSSTEDYNRFNTAPGIFGVNNQPITGPIDQGYFLPDPAAGTKGISPNAAIFCDPQVGCSDRIVAEDLSNEHSWQLSQEFRLASNFSGPLNFSLGGNYLHYETEENYYVFINALTVYSLHNDQFGGAPSRDHSDCLQPNGKFTGGWQNLNLAIGGGEPVQSCIFIDTNPISSLNNKGHNYFLSQNPYVVNSYAAFGEAYYQIASDLKLTGGLRWTEDRKHFVDIPSEVVTQGLGYQPAGSVDQQWDELTGRSALNWTPKLSFTDQTLIYASYSHGYKAGGANPPGAEFLELTRGAIPFPVHPATFRPEFINAYELGSKNTLLDGSLTLNADVFYYAYKDYQISEIVDRTSINLNFNANVKGAELETTWEPTPGLRFSFAGGYEDARVANGQSAIDLMDRTAGTPGWMVVKPFPTAASNCILPSYVVAALLQEQQNAFSGGVGSFACLVAYTGGLDPVTGRPYAPNPTGISTAAPAGSLNGPAPIPALYPGFDPTIPVINNGQGIAKNLSGNQLPNAPHFTASFTAEYTMPVSPDWAATLHGDFYWQADSMARVFNDKPYDQIHGYTSVNLSLILNSADGWQVMGYVKNIFNTTAISGDFLNSDDSGLTTNVFLTDPRLFGVRVTKDFTEGEPGSFGVPEFFKDIFSVSDQGKPSLWIEIGGQAENISGQGEAFAPAFVAANPTSSVLQPISPIQAQKPSMFSFGEEATVSFQPEGSDWIVSAAIRYGRSGNHKEVDHQTNGVFYEVYRSGLPQGNQQGVDNFADTQVHHKESHSILDFTAGNDVGLGMFGLDGSSILSGGVRFAQFTSNATFDVRSRPDLQFKYQNLANYGHPELNIKVPFFHTYHATGSASRSFHGVGPSLSWNGSAPVVGNLQDGEATFDWGANAAILFGKQKTRVRHHESGHYVPAVILGGGFQYYSAYDHPSGGHDTNRSVTVPNVGGFAGVSYRIKNAKISLGYRADFFLGAIDGGIDVRKSQTLGFMGPFAKISIGFGG